MKELAFVVVVIFQFLGTFGLSKHVEIPRRTETENLLIRTIPKTYDKDIQTNLI